MYIWSPESIRFRVDAAEYTRYDDVIAARILPHLSYGAHICDAGCGLGHLSCAIAECCARVTAIDTSAEALAVLLGTIATRGIANVEVLQGDLFVMQPQKRYDAMVFCFFGQVEETLRAAAAQCQGKVLLIKKNWSMHRFTPGEVPLKRFTYQQTLLELDALGVPYQAETFPVEMGQPFRSLEDATLFFETYRQEEDEEDIAPEQVKRRLNGTDSAAFPYFLPANRTLGLIAINARSIPDRFREPIADIGEDPFPDKNRRNLL